METISGIGTPREPGTELTMEELSRAIGENALLQTEVSRQMALRLVELRDQGQTAKAEIEQLRGQLQQLAYGVGHVLALARTEWQATDGTSNRVRPRIVPRLLNADKLLRMGAEPLLNIGCGAKPLPEYLNVDERELDGVDLVADVRALPFNDGTVAEIYAAHVIEHFTELELKSTLLPELRRTLRPGGILRITVPDAEGMMQAFHDGQITFENLRQVTYGGQEYPGNFHYTMFSRKSLPSVLRDAGFTAGEYVELARTNGLCLEMEIRARKA